MSDPLRIITSRAMREAEAQFMRETGVQAGTLMARAADALLRVSGELLDGGVRGRDVVIFCGPGANGGDGWALAWRLCDAGADVSVFAAALPAEGSAAALNYAECARRADRLRIAVSAEPQAYELPKRAELCVDARCGTGLARAPEGAYSRFIDTMRSLKRAGAAVLAVDIPSGLDGDSGALPGGADSVCPADATVTFQFLKQGQLFGAGQDLCGRLICADIGIPGSYAPAGTAELAELSQVRLPLRLHSGHKGTYGHALLAVGSRRYAGAAIMCAQGALRTGAGLITAACVQHVQPLLQQALPAVMADCVTEAPVLDDAAARALNAALEGKQSVCVGPGITRDASPSVIAAALESGLPAVLDADALNIIAQNDALAGMLHSNAVLTPHPGEMARLLRRKCADPLRDTADYAREHGCVVLLKGCATCVSDGARTSVICSGVPGMAAGGSGDVLSGVITALMAQGVPAYEAAVYGALLHGEAGAQAQAALGPGSMCATDIANCLAGAIKKITAPARAEFPARFEALRLEAEE